MALPAEVAESVAEALAKLDPTAVNRPHVIEAVRQEALRRFIVVTPRSSGQLNPDALLKARGQVTPAEGASLLEQLNRFDDTSLEPERRALNPAEECVQTVELLTRISFAQPALADTVQAAFRVLQPKMRELEEGGFIGRDTAAYADVYVPFALSQGSRSLYRPGLDRERRKQIAQFVRDTCKIPTVAGKRLTAALNTIGMVNETAQRDLLQLVADTVATIPVHFEQSKVFLRRRFPNVEVDGPRAVSPENETMGELLNAMYNDDDVPQSSVFAGSRARPVETRPTVKLPSASQVPAVGVKRPLAPTPIPYQPMQQPQRPQPVAESVAGRSLTGSYRGQHHCTSKYHPKYSTVDKHGSKDCAYCTICHMMEFLFNGCTRDCCWKHAPTDRKISMHLSGHPEVFKKAKEQFTEFRTRGRAAPLAIPL